jgi:hypothetical protein
MSEEPWRRIVHPSIRFILLICATGPMTMFLLVSIKHFTFVKTRVFPTFSLCER